MKQSFDSKLFLLSKSIPTHTVYVKNKDSKYTQVERTKLKSVHNMPICNFLGTHTHMLMIFRHSPERCTVNWQQLVGKRLIFHYIYTLRHVLKFCAMCLDYLLLE